MTKSSNCKAYSSTTAKPDSSTAAKPDNHKHVLRFVIIAFLAIGAFYLWQTRKEIIAENWGILFILLCPLMHLFMGCGGKDCKKEKGVKKSGSP